ncbi:MAG: dTMP kinase [Hyphomicrobiaceae bacterium]|nr:dTMP kinase [Hyphomicrobiaceae bacterium]
MARGFFITLEGGEGSGKSTQARLLVERLCAEGRDVLLTREPGGTPLGERIREIILSSRPSADAEFLLFSAARAEHVASKISPALAGGRWVVCDRYLDSTRVYQGDLAGIDAGLLRTVEQHVVRTARPNLTLILDLPPETGRARATARGALNRYDAEQMAYHERIREGFLAIATTEPQRCTVIDASRDAEAVAHDVWQAVASRFALPTG